MKKSKARVMLENLNEYQILRNKKERGFYIESAGDGRLFSIYRFGKIIAVEWLECAEAIVKHHDTRNWEVVDSPYAIIIPATYREGLSDEKITEEFINECLQRLRSRGREIANGPIEADDILPNGDIEVFIDRWQG